MAEPKGYLIGTEFYGKLRDVIGKVESLRLGGGGSQFEVDTSGDQPVASSHYLGKTTAAWSKGTSQSLTIYSGTPGSETAVSGWTVTAWNYVANLPGDIWVILARANGGFYVSSFDYTGLPGYLSTAQQVLAHNKLGQLVWLNTTECT